MICPRCGYNDDSIPTPRYSFKHAVLGTCKNCGHRIDIVPRLLKYSTKKGVEIGEKREEKLTMIYQRYKYGNNSHNEKYTDNIHLDRKIYVGNDLIEIMEIKEPTCSFNAFKKTIFSPNKIKIGQAITQKTNLPVYIILKFCDCWTSFKIDPHKEYEKQYNTDFKRPNHRKNESINKYKIIFVPIEDLELLMDLTLFTSNYDFPEYLIPEPVKPKLLKDFF